MSGNPIKEEELAWVVDVGRRRMVTQFRAESVRYDPAPDAIERTMVDGWGLWCSSARRRPNRPTSRLGTWPSWRFPRPPARRSRRPY